MSEIGFEIIGEDSQDNMVHNIDGSDNTFMLNGTDEMVLSQSVVIRYETELRDTGDITYFC